MKDLLFPASFVFFFPLLCLFIPLLASHHESLKKKKKKKKKNADFNFIDKIEVEKWVSVIVTLRAPTRHANRSREIISYCIPLVAIH